MRDLPALWASEGWRAELESWLMPALAAAGRHVTGPLVQERIRFWSTVLHVETDAGRVWVKENAPSQSFEAGLVATVDGLVPGLMAPVLAADADRGWLVTADLGLPLWHDETPPPAQEWVAVVADYARGQRILADHEEAMLATGLPIFPREPDAVTAWVESLLNRLRSLPEGDVRRPSDQEDRAVRDGFVRLHDAATVLASSRLPSTLQHNDLHLGNAFRRSGGAALIDLGDALWAHPLTTLRIPLWIMRHRFALAAGAPEVLGAIEAAIEPWLDLADRDTITALLPAAERLSCLHRAESWRRLQADVPVSSIPEPFLRSVPEWLVDAAAPDPYLAAVGR